MTLRCHRSAALLAAALSPTLACNYEPHTPELHYSLNANAVAGNPDLSADEGAQAQLFGALEMMFGTPKNPRFLALPEWVEEGFDPNYWGEDHVKAEDAALKLLVESNRQAYRQQLAAIRAGEFDAVQRPRFADDLWERWLRLRAEMPAGGPDAEFLTTDDGQKVSWREEALYRFENYYPTMASSAALYHNQCFHCHGAEGGGDGSTSRFLEPRPRDYRPGKFKFTALKGKARPRHEDVFRILAEGIYTTAMPSFRRFTDAQLHGLVDYVRLLSIRGETEILLASFYDPAEGLHFDNVRENYVDVVGRWRGSAEQLITFDGPIPDATPERVAHGRALFTTPGEKGGANCVSCHGTSGRGDGPSVWEPGKVGIEYTKDDWGNQIQPRDFTRGVFRFGRRPIDLYRRIYAGINGTPMPEHIGMTITEDGKQRAMTEDDIWDLVFFVRELSSQSPLVASAGGGGGRSH
jgi:mono/diheme cytochrome c family protein